jgi:high-affinity nickel permease
MNQVAALLFTKLVEEIRCSEFCGFHFDLGHSSVLRCSTPPLREASLRLA